MEQKGGPSGKEQSFGVRAVRAGECRRLGPCGHRPQEQGRNDKTRPERAKVVCTHLWLCLLERLLSRCPLVTSPS